MRKKDWDIALAYAPIICQETFGTFDERYQDYFCRADYDGDFKANNNWDNLAKFKDKLKAEVYFSLVETKSHYFILYSVYHAKDWKVLGKHENDMEHAQVVVKKKGTKGVIQFLCTNAHHSYYIYFNEQEVDIPQSWLKNQYSGTILINESDGRPVIFVQPGNGFNQFGGVGHGIVGITGAMRKRWKGDAFNFPGGQGLVCFPHQTGEIPDPEKENQSVQYSLISTEEDLWPLRDTTGDQSLFGEAMATWNADGDDYVDLDTKDQIETRKEYFLSKNASVSVKYAKSFNGNEGMEDEGKTPFAFQMGVPALQYWRMRGMPDAMLQKLKKENKLINTTQNFDNFFDPAHGWFLRLGGRIVSIDYTYHPYIGV